MKQMLLNNLKNEIFSCNKCSICKSKQVFFCGNPDANVMLIGEAPGKDEVKFCKPFVGAAGKNLTSYLEELNIDREKDLYITNVVKCRPTPKENPNKNKKPDDNEIKSCIHFLKKEIEIVNPKLIVLCGGTSYKALTNKKSFKIGEIRGKYFNLQVNNSNYEAVTIYHPSYLMQYAKPEQIDVTKKDLNAIKNYLDLK